METPRALRLLRKAGVERIVMVTGDRRDVAETIGALLGVDEVLAEQKPEDKLAAIKASHLAGSTIMVGDGVNDAPALAAADVGVAMGARGTAASAEAAGVVLLVDRLDRLAEALRISHRARAVAVESVVAGMGLSMVAIGAAALGYLPPLASGPCFRRRSTSRSSSTPCALFASRGLVRAESCSRRPSSMLSKKSTTS